MVQVTRRQLRELLAQLDGHIVGHVGERVGIGQLAYLVGDGQGHLLTAQANVGAPHAADCIEEAVAVGIADVGALAGNDVQRALLAVLVEHMVAVHVVGLVGFHQRVVGSGECFAWGSHGQLLGSDRWAVFRNRS